MSPSHSHAPPQSHHVYGFRARSLPPIDHYGYSGPAFLETTSYHDAFVHPEWRHAIVEIVALVRIGTWDVISLPLVPSLESASIMLIN